MPAQSQQQQKLFGLALAFKRGDVPASEISDEVKAIADRMSEKEIEDFAATKHKNLPKVKERIKKIVREILKEKTISELNEQSVTENVGIEAKGIAGFTGTRSSAVQDFIDKNELDSKKLLQYVKKGGLKARMSFVSALAGKDGNRIQQKIISKFK